MRSCMHSWETVRERERSPLVLSRHIGQSNAYIFLKNVG